MAITVKKMHTKIKDEQGYLYDMDVYVSDVTKVLTETSEEPAADPTNDTSTETPTEEESEGGE